MFKVDKGSNICLYYTILAFGLAIGLRMKSVRKPSFDDKKVAHQQLKLWDKKRASISHDWVGKAMVLNYYIDNNFC